MAIQTVFERTEKKYIITLTQRKALLRMIEEYIKPDEYGESTVCSLYFDTEDYRLIRRSMEKPAYKEKLRLRSYSIPKAGSKVLRKAQAEKLLYSQGGKQGFPGAKKEIQRRCLQAQTDA